MKSRFQIFDLRMLCRVLVLLFFSSSLYAGLLDTKLGQTEPEFTIHHSDSSHIKIGSVKLKPVAEGDDIEVEYTPKGSSSTPQKGKITAAVLSGIESRLVSHQIPEGIYMNQVAGALSCLYAWDLDSSGGEIVSLNDALTVTEVTVTPTNEFEIHLSGTVDGSGTRVERTVVTIEAYDGRANECKIWVKIKNKEDHTLKYMVDFGNNSAMLSRGVIQKCPGYQGTDKATTKCSCW
ncbi:hypothetical protein ACWJJH_18165 [Endozoicomonadaceae bacterium StTr2]